MGRTKPEKVAGEATKKESEKPTKTIAKKPRVVKQIPPVPEMVTSAIKQKPEGCTLQVIRNYIVKQYGARMTKKLQASIKEYITIEFDQGRIKMANNDGNEIKFNQPLLQVVR